MTLPVEVRKALVQKRMEASKRMQGSITCEKYGVYMRTYGNLRINTAQDHNDPSDHVIIAHAITNHIPLITDDGKFEFYKKQGLELIVNKK